MSACTHNTCSCVHMHMCVMDLGVHMCTCIYITGMCFLVHIYTCTCACSRLHTRAQTHSTYHTHTCKTFGSLCKHSSQAEPQSPLWHSSKVHTQLCLPCTAPRQCPPMPEPPACGSLAVPPPAPASTLTLLLYDRAGLDPLSAEQGHGAPRAVPGADGGTSDPV